MQETPKNKRESTGSEKRSAKKQRTDSNASSNNRLGSLSPALNHSTPMRKTGSLLDRPANISTPVSHSKLLSIYLISIFLKFWHTFFNFC